MSDGALSSHMLQTGHRRLLVLEHVRETPCTVPAVRTASLPTLPRASGNLGPRLSASARGAEDARPGLSRTAAAVLLGSPWREGVTGALVTVALASMSWFWHTPLREEGHLMTDGQKAPWSGVLLGLMFLAILLGGLLVLRLTGNERVSQTT